MDLTSEKQNLKPRKWVILGVKLSFFSVLNPVLESFFEIWVLNVIDLQISKTSGGQNLESLKMGHDTQMFLTK